MVRPFSVHALVPVAFFSFMATFFLKGERLWRKKRFLQGRRAEQETHLILESQIIQKVIWNKENILVVKKSKNCWQSISTDFYFTLGIISHSWTIPCSMQWCISCLINLMCKWDFRCRGWWNGIKFTSSRIFWISLSFLQIIQTVNCFSSSSWHKSLLFFLCNDLEISTLWCS